MKRNTNMVAGLTVALLGSTLAVACGGRTIENEWTGGTSGFGGTGGNGAAGGSGGSTGGSDGSTGGLGGSTGGSDGSTGGFGGTTVGAGGTTGGSGGATGGVGGSTGGVGGSGGTTGGKAGVPIMDGGSGKAGAPSVDGGAPITCGTSLCRSITSPIGTWFPCCPMDTPNACGGLVLGTVCLTTTPGVADPTCPTITVQGMALPGCCRPNGLCGANLAVIGLGCSDPATLGAPAGGKCNPPPLN